MVTNNINNQVNLPLNDTTLNILQSLSSKWGLDITELLEKIAMDEFIILSSEEMEDLLDTISGLEGLLSAQEEGTVSWDIVKKQLGY